MHVFMANELFDIRTPSKLIFAVRVEAVHLKGKQYELIVQPDSACAVRMDAAFAPLPERIKIFSVDREEVLPTYRFWISVDTFNPFHLVTDVEDPQKP